MSTTNSLVPQKLIDAVAVCEALDIGKATLERMQAANLLPRAIRVGIGSRTRRWRADEIADWIENECPPLEQWEALKAASKKNGR
jgi:predicted DNA-binding transcriptional regulator AlpA